MAFAAFLLFVVIPGHTLSIHSDTFSSFVDFYNNVCPPCHNDSEPSDFENRCCSFCDCDLEYCKEYGTCCLGVYNSFEAANESVSKTVYTCVDPNVYANDGASKYQMSGVQLISRCISSSPNPTIKDLCENPDVDRDLETMIPVTDYSTGLLYRNQYCALCSDQTSYDRIRRWDKNIDCEDDVSYTYEHLYHIFRDRTCNISFASPDYVQVESCVPYEIGTCNVSGHWKVYNGTLERACNSFIDPFNLTYKNVFCFLCNVDTSISVDLSQCQTYNGTQDLKSVTLVNVPFLAMLDLSAVLMKQTSIHAVQLKCNKHVQFADAKVGVCRDILCDETQYLYFDGSCALKPRYENPLCYILSLKVTPLIGDFLPRHFADDIISFMKEDNDTFLYAEVYVKETESDDNLVDYIIFHGITNDVNFALEKRAFLDNLSVYIVMNVGFFFQSVAYNISYFNGQYILEEPSIPFETNHDDLVKVYKPEPRNGSNDCINKTLVYTNKLMKCPFVQLKLAEVNINITNGYLFFLDINTTSFSWFEYKHVNDSIFICLSDYKLVYKQLPEMTRRKIETPRFLTEVSLKNRLSLLCVCVSIVCLLVTMVILIVMPDFHTQPGLNTFVLCFCLLLAQTIFQFGVGQTHVSAWLCSMVGAIRHFSWLCVMFAMNICSLDMFLIFRKLKITRFDSPYRKVFQRVVYILAFSLFFLAINIIVSLSKSKGEDIGYGGAICYISSRNMQILTFIVPSVLTILINITLFIVVVFKLSKTSIRTAGLNKERNYFRIYARLSTLTGFTWIVGFLLLLIQNEVLEYVFILLNASQGLFIMIAFAFNSRLVNQCCGKLSQLRSELRSTRFSK